jgi:lysyl oxidase-like protein 2/3/4
MSCDIVFSQREPCNNWQEDRTFYFSFQDAPDLTWDIKELASTLEIRNFPMVALQCAKEENCLSSSAYSASYDIQLQRYWTGLQRRLLRFSAKVHNVGTAAYRPYLGKNAWKFHTCHNHYHSDEEFAFYDMIGKDLTHSFRFGDENLSCIYTHGKCHSTYQTLFPDNQK